MATRQLLLMGLAIGQLVLAGFLGLMAWGDGVDLGTLVLFVLVAAQAVWNLVLIGQLWPSASPVTQPGNPARQ